MPDRPHASPLRLKKTPRRLIELAIELAIERDIAATPPFLNQGSR